MSLGLCTAITIAGCGSTGSIQAPISPSAVGELRPDSGYLRGYLARDELPDSLALVPPPPSPGSAAFAADVEAFWALTALRDGPRGDQAAKDAMLRFPMAANAFSCALGVSISEKYTPNVNMLLRRTLSDAGLATYKAKENYRRTRPFVHFNVPSCTPREEAMLRNDGSYPSGHSALGWAWALVLTEVAPERTDALLQRGRSFAQSRGVCGVHWKSDIEAGYLVGSATVARLQSNAMFLAQVEAARQEIVNARSQGRAPSTKTCGDEAQVLQGTAGLGP